MKRLLVASTICILLCGFATFTGCSSASDEIPPADISSLSAQPESEGIVLSWTNPSDSDFSNVEIYVTSADNSYSHTFYASYGSSSYTITGLYNNLEYTVLVRAVDANGNHSTGVLCSAVPDSANGPANVQNLSISYGEGTATLTWTNPRDSKFAGVSITVTNNNASATGTSSSTTTTSSAATATSSTATSSTETSATATSSVSSAAASTSSAATTATAEKKTRTFTTDSASQNTYTITGLTYGASYTFVVRTFDTDAVYSKELTSTGKIPVESEGLQYKLSSDGASYIISGYTGDSSRSQTITPEQEAGAVANPITVTIFSKYKNKPVTAIGTEAFANCRNITQVSLPSTIVSIAENAFQGCTALVNITLPSGITSISDGAFWNCASLSWIVIPKSVTSIGLGATLGDSSLTHVFYTGTQEEWNTLIANTKSGNAPLTGTVSRLLSTPAEIRYNYDGSSAIEFIAPQPVTDLVAEQGLSHVALSWTNPSDADFAGVIVSAKPAEGSLATSYKIFSRDTNSYVATSLTNGTKYTFTVTAFDDADNRSTEVTSDAVTCGAVEKTDVSGLQYYISESGTSCIVNGFEGTPSLVVIPNRLANLPVTQITASAFVSDAIELVVLPNTLTKVEEGAFAKCPNLHNVFYEGDEASWNAIDGAADIKAMPHWNFTYNASDTVPPAEVSNLEMHKGDGKIVLEYEAPSDNDFADVSVTVNGEAADVVHVCFDTVVVRGLTNGTVYQVTVKTCDLYGNVSAGVTVSAEAGEISAEGKTASGLLYRLITGEGNGDLDGTSYEVYSFEPKNQEIASVAIPESIHGVSVTQIGEDAFASCGTLKSVSIPKTVSLIKPNAFVSCTALKTLVVDSANKNYALNADGTILYRKTPGNREVVYVLKSLAGTLDLTDKNIVAVNEGALNGCSSVTSVILPKTLKTIDADAFKNCTSLKSLSLPKDVKTIADNAFSGCDNLSNCYYAGSLADWKKIVISENGNSSLLNASIIYDYNK